MAAVKNNFLNFIYLVALKSASSLPYLKHTVGQRQRSLMFKSKCYKVMLYSRNCQPFFLEISSLQYILTLSFEMKRFYISYSFKCDIICSFNYHTRKKLVFLNLLYTIKYAVFKLGVSKMSNQRTIKQPTYSVLNFN